ncbi:putative endoplasmic reticulum-Golgi intermediate compartment protein 3 [Smittium mucronatum]|uniref:Putative endoplasmic reticulum-Golgi intermediate compartment protein 3 n=1 Tax=Smittium mucronatum TaxID=133383 RepID=A0A1R0H425_9FUNG|nr:putative endoplasmic reticulum-Golgi intermediate compartment protein 3 [Smittium mucronatum]
MAREKSVFSRLQAFDAYAKTMDDFKVKTISGAMVTIISILTVVLLIFSEYRNYKTIDMVPELIVDKERMEKMKIHIDITFNRAPCAILGLDIMDSTGEHQINSFENVVATRLLPNGKENKNPKVFVDKEDKTLSDPKYCGSCYGGVPPESGCCNTCSEVHSAYQKQSWSFMDPSKIEQCVRENYIEKIKDQEGEGCRLVGSVEINKVSGNFHIMAGETVKKNSMHAHIVHDYMPQDFDFSHTINKLTFGDDLASIKNPLDGVSKKATTKMTKYQYFTKVVGTEARFLNGKTVISNQFSVTEHVTEGLKGSSGSSNSYGFFVIFDISPMRIILTQHTRSLSSFISSCLAIIGSIFTVAGLVDSFIFRAENAILHKREIGKQA